jgi:hypothetical protein
MSETSSRPAAKQRRRYPLLNLEQAVDRLRILHDRERLNAAPADVIVQHWGFKSINTGPASSAYSAVKQFGLLDETGSGKQRKASISPRGRAILTAPADVRQEELRAAALEPTMNRLIWERYGAHTGSPEAFRWHLISDLGFSDTGAKEFAKQYEATIRFAGLDDEDSPTEAADLAVDSDEPHDVGPVEAASYPVAPTSDVWHTRSGQRVEVPVHHAPSSARMSRHAIPLVGGKQVILEGEFPLSEAAWQGFLAVLQAFKPGLVEAEGAATAVPPEDEELL